MGEPTDEQITRHLAKVAGAERDWKWDGKWLKAWTSPAMGQMPVTFSPLTDWRDLGPIIVQHRVWLAPRHDDCWSAKKYGTNLIVDDKDPKLAACLAIYYATGGE